jgi:hypothetical protein
MRAGHVITMSENFASMTFDEGLAFIGRTRRQLDRFDDALPHAEGESIDPAEAIAIRLLCDELETDINRSLSHA